MASGKYKEEILRRKWAVGLGIATDYALQYSDYQYERRLDNAILSIKRERMGVGGISINRSRSLTQ